MKKISSMRKLAEHLVACEAGSVNTDSRKLLAQPVCDKLRPPLATLMGTTGFRALLTRALARATVRVIALRGIYITPAGVLERLATSEVQGKPAPENEGSVELIAELLGLLCAFIGIKLTLQLVRDIWPALPFNDLDFESGDTE
jgi:hypothetical protein